MATAILVPGNYEPEPNPSDVTEGLAALEDLANNGERVRQVGRGVTSIVNSGTPRAVGNIASSAYVVPRRVGEIVQIGPGVYRLN